ncbi:MAG: hypothetical protein ACIAXF_05020 [Phycisphaerales bacterium JB063]
MRGKAHQPEVSAQTIAGWRSRLDRLDEMLCSAPDGDWAWLWRVRAEVVRYLLHRYAANADPPAPARVCDAADRQDVTSQAADRAPAVSTMNDERLNYANARVAKSPTLPGPELAQLHDGMRGRLSSLSQANDDRRANQPPIPPAPIPKPVWSKSPPMIGSAQPQRLDPIDELRETLPVWLERVLFMPVSWPLRLATPLPRMTRDDRLRLLAKRVACADPISKSCPAPDVDEDGAQVGTLDAESLALLRVALQDDERWDLAADEVLSEDEIARLLGVRRDMQAD